MTALPEPVSWTPPGPGLWMRNFRLGEWLPEAVTPLFATWLLPVMEDGLPRRHARHRRRAGAVPVRAGQRLVLQRHPDPVTAAARTGAVAGPRPCGEDPVQRADPGRPRPGRRRPRGAVRPGPAVARDAAARATGGSSRTPQPRPPPRPRDRLVELVDAARPGGRDLPVVSGDRRRLGMEDGSLPDPLLPRSTWPRCCPTSEGGAQVLLRGLPGAQPVSTPHAVQSVDWYHPVAAELPAPPAMPDAQPTGTPAGRSSASPPSSAAGRHWPAGRDCWPSSTSCCRSPSGTRSSGKSRPATSPSPGRSCAPAPAASASTWSRPAPSPAPTTCSSAPATRSTAGLTGGPRPGPARVAERRDQWQRQRRLAAPLTLGRPPRLIGDVIDRAVQQARGTAESRRRRDRRASGIGRPRHRPGPHRARPARLRRVPRRRRARRQSHRPGLDTAVRPSRRRGHRRRHPRRARLPGRPRIRHPRRRRHRRRHPAPAHQANWSPSTAPPEPSPSSRNHRRSAVKVSSGV